MHETDPLIVTSSENGTTKSDAFINGKDLEAAVSLIGKNQAATSTPTPSGGNHDDDLLRKQWKLLLAMGLILPYVGLVTTLLCANNFDQDTVIETHYFMPFHMYEFWGGVYFALVEAYVLLVADDSFRVMNSKSQSMLVHLLSINIVSSMVAASLFTLNPEMFEVPSHYIEYSSQVTVTMLDAFFILLPNRNSQENNGKRVGSQVRTVLLIFLILMDFGKFLVYSKVIHTTVGHERSSHYFEFVVELFNSLWAFWYIKGVYMQTLRSND